jgi:glucosamine-6-phosphate isomerase
MKIFVAATYEELSKQAADDAITLLRSIKQPLICPASGDTPAGLYKYITTKGSKDKLDISGWLFVGLDEWSGMDGNDEGSCRFHLNNQLFNPLDISPGRIRFFNGRTKDGDKECNDIEHFIVEQGGIDLAILGLGMNGHIGMNEPGTSASLRSHVTELDTITKNTAQKYFKEQRQLTKGITLGLATLTEARHIFLLVSGSHKAAVVKKMLESEVSEDIPGSLLRNHPGLSIYLDAEAAKLIHPGNTI